MVRSDALPAVFRAVFHVSIMSVRVVALGFAASVALMACWNSSISRPWSSCSALKGLPYDNAVVESTNKILKAEFVYRERFDSLEELQIKLSDYVWWYNHERMHSTLGYMSPVEFREKSLTIMPNKGCQSKRFIGEWGRGRNTRLQGEEKE